MSYETINYSLDGGVAHIELARPDALNAWTPVMGQEMRDAVKAVADDPEARSILITGQGKAFSSGADLKYPRDDMPDGSADLSSRLRQIYGPLIIDLRQIPKPVVAGVHGASAGIGFSLAMASDLVIAAESSYFLMAFIRIGLIPDGGATMMLPAKIGLGRANKLAMLGEKLPAAQAHEWGLVDELVPDDQVHARARELAAELATKPTAAIGDIKAAFNAALYPNLAEHIELEADLQQNQATRHDYAEGVNAFREKRAPRFTGD